MRRKGEERRTWRWRLPRRDLSTTDSRGHAVFSPRKVHDRIYIFVKWRRNITTAARDICATPLPTFPFSIPSPVYVRFSNQP